MPPSSWSPTIPSWPPAWIGACTSTTGKSAWVEGRLRFAALPSAAGDGGDAVRARAQHLEQIGARELHVAPVEVDALQLRRRGAPRGEAQSGERGADGAQRFGECVLGEIELRIGAGE